MLSMYKLYPYQKVPYPIYSFSPLLILLVLRPGGQLTLVQILPSDQDPASITSSLVLAGLTSQGPPRPLETLPSLEESLAKLNMTSGTAYQVELVN